MKQTLMLAAALLAGLPLTSSPGLHAESPRASFAKADTPVQNDELLAGFVHPPVNFTPGERIDFGKWGVVVVPPANRKPQR